MLEFDLVSGDVLGARSEEREVTSLHCSSAKNAVVALLEDRYVRVYKELAMHGANGLRPVLQHRCTRQGRDQERVGSSALSQGARATFFFSKKGRANVYSIDAFADESVCDIMKVRGAKKALKTEPTELVCHPSKPLFVAVSESAAIVGTTAEICFSLDVGRGSGRLQSLSFHPMLPRMLAIRGTEILCWDVSDSQKFRLLASVQAPAPPEGVHFLPGISPYFCSLAIDKTTEPVWRCDACPWYLDESEEQPLQQSTAMNSSVLAELVAHYRGIQADVPLKRLMFPHTVLPIVVVMGRASFAVARCIDRVCPTTVVPSAAVSHLSLKHLTADMSGERVGQPPEKLRFMNERRVWAYEPAAQVCAVDTSDGDLASLTLSAKATACSTLERQDCPDGEFVLATACMEFGGGTRAAFFQTPGAKLSQRSCKDAALVDTTDWPGSQSPGVVAAVISEDGTSLSFEGKHAEASGCAGPHLVGCAVSRVFSTPFCNRAALLFVDNANQVRFSCNRIANVAQDGGAVGGSGSDWSNWAVWSDGPGLRLHGDETVISAAWQEGSGESGDLWQPVLALLTSRRVILLSRHLEVMTHADIEPGSPSPVGVPSGIWCGVVFLYTTPSQIRWLALDGTTGGLVSLPSLNVTLCAVTQSCVTILCPDGHRSFIHSIPVGLCEPLALGWIIAFKSGQASLCKAVQHIQFLSDQPGSAWTVSATLLQHISEVTLTRTASCQALTQDGDEEGAALQTLLQIGLAVSFSEKMISKQFPLETRLNIALRCGAYELGYEALRHEWVEQSEPSLRSASSGLGRRGLEVLFEQLAGACRSAGEADIERQCRLLLCNHWDPLHDSETSMDEKPKRFADVLEMQARRLPSAAPLPPAEAEKPVSLQNTVGLSTAFGLPVGVRRNWVAMGGVRIQAFAASGSSRDVELPLEMTDDVEEPHDFFPASVSASDPQYGNSGTGASVSPAQQHDDDSDDQVSTDGVGSLSRAGFDEDIYQINSFTSSDDDDDGDGAARTGRGRQITFEIKQPSTTVSRSSVSAILEGATSIPLSTDSRGSIPARSSMKLAAPPRTLSTLAPPPRTSTLNK